MEPTDENRRAWNAIHRERRPARTGLPRIVEATLGDLSGKRVLSLQCGTGESSARLAELGAIVTAVDPVDALLDEARERWPSILWIEAEADALPAELRRGRFDLVYSPEGVLQRVADLTTWTRGLVGAMRAGGELLVYDDHPAALCLDGLQHWHYDYFAEGFWRLGQIVTALVRAN
ncbi:MAG TPA: methyltransferase domain-containing protein, partial [Gaiellaceae bacterium]|nr:methyltransferase domain-containing protein [Gaiellaceae bacterium]